MRLFSLLFLLFLSFQSSAQLEDGLYAKINTTKGDIILKLFFEKTPLTVINFAGLAQGEKNSNQAKNKPFYDGLKFHRVIDNFMVQGGDPKGNGTGGPGYKFADEITDLKHDKPGILSMANAGANTNGSQFFITHKATPWLDGKHSVFGETIEGMDVVNAIKQGDIINKVEIIRIGQKAKNFKTNEDTFNAQNQKYEIIKKQKQVKKQQKLIDFVKQKSPDAKKQKDGYFIKITKNGSDKKAKKGDLAKIKLTILTDTGITLAKGDKELPFSVGAGRFIKIIEDTVLDMKIGEVRKMFATYYQVFGNKKQVSIPLDAILIFEIKLLSVNKID